LIGRTGSGKSATFKQLAFENEHRVIRIDPEELSLPFLLNNNMLRWLAEIDVHLDPFFVALWQHVIIVEVLKHKYHIDSLSIQVSVLDELKRLFSKKKRTLDYLEEFGEQFWLPVDERIKTINARFEKQLGNAEGSIAVGVGPVNVKLDHKGGEGESHSIETVSEIRHQYQAIVNSTQLPRLKEMINLLGDEILSNERDFVYVVIDDLDKNWVDDDFAVILIRCLFDAVISMQHVANLKILVALRTNILNQLNFEGQRRGRQQEKVHGLTMEMRWSASHLEELLNQRFVAVAEEGYVEEGTTLKSFLPPRNRTLGDPVDFIMSRTLMRPRDAISFCNEIAEKAAGKPLPVKWEHLTSAERVYSSKRMDALADEWKDPYFGLERILKGFRGRGVEFRPDQMIEILDDIVFDCISNEHEKYEWLNRLVGDRWNGPSKEHADLLSCYGEVVKILFRTGFLGLSRHSSHEAPLFSYTFDLKNIDLASVGQFVIHPAFRAALGYTDYKIR
jgi:hypothetical protein